MKGSIKSERGRLRRAIVIGTGRAGLTATLELAQRNVPVLLIGLGPSFQAQSARDREAFNAFDSGSRDTPEQHAEDTRAIGGQLASDCAIGRLCTAAPELLEWLVTLGVPFVRQPAGTFERVRLRASSRARSVHVQANTGRHIVGALDALVRTLEATPATDEVGISVAGEKLVRRLEYWRFVSLVLDDHGICVGVLAQDCRTLTFKAFPADGVVLASGDYAGLFAESAASATSSSGAALGAVYKQGAVLSNLEFVEHHPLVVGRGAARVALPELLRAKGARVTQVGKRNSTQSLDLTGLDAAPLAALVESLGPTLGQLLGADLAREGVPVQLRALRGLGGVWVDCEPSTSAAGFSPRQHATSIPGLYAAGAADAQYHGAASLPGNLAPADLLGGQLAARGVVCFRESLSKSACDLPKSVFDKPANIAEQDLGDQFTREADRDGMGPHELLAILRSEMARLCGVSRSAEGLEALAERLVELQQKCQRVSVNGPSTGHNPEALVAAMLNDQLVLARAVVNSALWREESRGAHQRSDFGPSSAAFERASLTQAASDSGPRTLTSFDYSCAGQNVSIGK